MYSSCAICDGAVPCRWVTGLQWSQQDAFNAAEEERWQLDGAIVGSIKESGPLSFVKIFKAGHMVRQPHDIWVIEFGVVALIDCWLWV